LDDFTRQAQEYVHYKRVLRLIAEQRMALVAGIDEVLDAFAVEKLDKMNTEQLKAIEQELRQHGIGSVLLAKHLRIKTRKKTK
jgi:hypothetical protein